MQEQHTYTVSFTDTDGIEHAVRVSAASLFEAATLALAAFQRHGFTDTSFGSGTQLVIRVKTPEVKHIISVGKLKTWLEGSGKTPNEQALKSRLRALL